MTVIIPTKEFSPEQRRRLVLEYLERPHGTKRAFLKEQDICFDQLRRWQAALADGDLDRGLVPRKTGVMTRRDATEIRRLQAEVDRLNDQLAAERKAVDALGKAISVMHSLGVADGAEDQTGSLPSSKPTSS